MIVFILHVAGKMIRANLIELLVENLVVDVVVFLESEQFPRVKYVQKSVNSTNQRQADAKLALPRRF